MTSIETLLKNNEGKINFARYTLLPIVITAIFFFLDARYLTKGEYISSMGDNKAAIIQLASEQKTSFIKLTDAISTLTVEQRNSAESQRISAITLNASIIRMDKHENADLPKFEKINYELEKDDVRFNSIERQVDRHETTINRNTDIINKVILKP